MQPQLSLLTFRLRWRRLTVAQRGTIAIAIPLICWLTSFGSVLWLRYNAIRKEALVDHSQNVLLASRTLLLNLLDAETGARGYYITRQPTFLKPYQDALTRLPQTVNALQQLTRNDPVQTVRVNTLAQLVNQEIDSLQPSIKQSGTDPFQANAIAPTSATISQLQLLQSKQVMDQVRVVLHDLESAEQQQLGYHQQQLIQQRDLNIVAIFCGIVISSLASVIAIGLFRDLSKELRRREELLQESQNLIRAIFMNVVDGVVILDADEAIESFNTAAQKMFSYSLDQVIGKHWTVLVPEPSAVDHHVFAPLPPVIDLLTANQPWQAMGQRQDGTWFPIEISTSLIDLDDRYLMIIRDITERQQAAAKLQARADELVQLNTKLQVTNQALRETNRELDQFAYVVAHDLKAPLRAIASLSEWIEEDLSGQLPIDNQIHMQLLRGRVTRMEALLNGLLEYARLGRTDVLVETVDVAKLLDIVIRNLTPPSTFKIRVVGEMPVLKARQALLEQVFANLIGNAIEHHPSEVGTVAISVRDEGDRYEFAIADDGHGIDPRFHDKIYTIFQTLEARDTRDNRGIGLAVVKKIVEMEGGHIQLESSIGKGAIFRFTWRKEPARLDQHSLGSLPLDRYV